MYSSSFPVNQMRAFCITALAQGKSIALLYTVPAYRHLFSKFLDSGDEGFDFICRKFAFERGHLFFAMVIAFSLDDLFLDLGLGQLALCQVLHAELSGYRRLRFAVWAVAGRTLFVEQLLSVSGDAEGE